MNYTYKIKNNLVTEFKNKAYNEWNFEILKKNTAPNILSFIGFDENSFYRTKEWLLRNHPELLL
jgi:hypothetical protein